MTTAQVHSALWGHLPGGQPIHRFTLTLPGGVQARFSSLGATLVSLHLPDRTGTPGEVVLGHDQAETYLDRDAAPFLGSTVGRHANRIARGRFPLGGREVQLVTNDGPNALHGGPRGFDLHLWTGEAAPTDGGAQVTFTRVSPDGEEGYPGTLNVRVTYALTLSPDPTLSIAYHAETDAPTVVNLTNHTYWNLSGNPAETIAAHELTLHAEHYTPIHPDGIPTGEVLAVAGTPMDFRTPRAIGEQLRAHQGTLPGGYDHNFVVRGEPGALRPAATLYHPASGREMSIHTTEPGLQVYSGNFLDGRHTGHGGRVHVRNSAVCLETQHFPDAPNRPQFPSTHLNPGQTFTSLTTHTFRVR
ncbi:galactose mutarotase [Deinococcus taeanensis]|uniref:aldose epimerase family protein n=1 Tax=Deinococcus taeanensis TaxID=2737050 RepID=UPI001CDB7908|nr:aldose epimerase family protein [Deinococcus taeanensis]UBV42326.1 galactose mutarotase [Deinococcus taeanensis]